MKASPQSFLFNAGKSLSSLAEDLNMLKGILSSTLLIHSRGTPLGDITNTLEWITSWYTMRLLFLTSEYELENPHAWSEQ